MAKPIRYTPAPSPTGQADAQAADLIRALYDSGLLRAATGAVRAYPDLAKILIRGVDADKMKALAALGGLSGVLGSQGARQLVSGITAGVAAADKATSLPAPSVLTLAKQLGDPDVRRGVAAAIAAVGAFGRAVAARKV
ncbi:hypothetical protein BH24ACT15_BH24ACT15_02600 [soil metagenome]